ncbi:MAG TPA: hypothetical protein VMT98_17500 [Verrucomicrobiae bacterium]|nr:hypothetical protein [Verrucomicrobiae bacterium]
MRFGFAAAAGFLIAGCGEVDLTMPVCREQFAGDQCACIKERVSAKTWTAMRRLATARKVGGEDLYRAALVSEFGGDPAKITENMGRFFAEYGEARDTCVGPREPILEIEPKPGQ